MKVKYSVSHITDANSQRIEHAAFTWLFASPTTDLTTAKRKLKQAINDELTETQRRYVFDYYIKGHSMEAIGITYGVNKSTVSRTIKRARRRLYRVLKYTNESFL